MKKNFFGKYKIIEMTMWDIDYIDLVVPGFIEIKKDGYVEFQFGVVEGAGTYSHSKDGKHIDFEWEGSDECDEASGECELEIIGDKMTGTISFDNGDESGFVAIKKS